ncbi:MAG: hypothetical protein IPO37_25635 [Saprospiraceae bacterium]|nr:hypothetical protein [Saprospiraceae bacterium]
MIKDIVFSKVNNFWIDNGIVGLFKVLEHIKENVIITDDSENIIEYEITLSADNLKIELTSNLVEDVESNEMMLFNKNFE